jgi:starvation-inducible DNA-binding protein
VNPQNEALAKQLAHLLSDVVTFKFLVHGYHWNVKGPAFSQFHDFFSDIYGDADGSIDPIAENIRKIGYDAPYMLTDFSEMTCLKNEERQFGDSMEMVKSIARTNQAVLACATEAFNIANGCNQQGIANFLAERIDMHQKWQWQLESTLGLR